MREDNDRQGKSKERIRSSYMLTFAAALGLVMLAIISMFL
jgi:hypothetical protein